MKKTMLKRLTVLGFVLLFFFPLKAQKNRESITLPEISKEIIAMRGPDQKYRIKWAKLVKAGKTETKKFKKISATLKAIDRQNTARMRAIVSQYGWPTYDLVGERASNSAWLIVQHADRSPLFQAHCLPLLKEAVDGGQANPRNYAYLYDRVQVAKGGKQLYATQSSTNNGIKKGTFQTIEEEAKVQERREAMGIRQHIEDYAKALGFEYKVPTPAEAVERAKTVEAFYQLNVRKAKAAMAEKDYEAAITFYKEATSAYGYTQTEDYVALARALSLAKHKDCSWAYYHLMKAAIRGYEGINEFDADEDFRNIKLANPGNWEDLMAVVAELNQ